MSGDSLTGSVERITYYNSENGYSVVRLRPDRGRGLPGLNREGLVTVVGNLPEISPGEHLRLSGRWATHPKHGQQFEVEICEQTLPATIAGIRRYLGSGLIKGIGPRLAERIVTEFGADTLQVIEETPERLRDVPDIGPKRAGMIATAWEEQRQVKEIMLFLHGHGVSTNLAIKIYKEYGDAALGVVQSNPYQMAADIYGVGFKTADRIAQALGLPEDHPSRIEAGLEYALNEMVDNGHVYAPRQALAERAVELLGVNAELMPPALERLAKAGRVREESVPYTTAETNGADLQPGVSEAGDDYGLPAVYLSPLFHSEVGVAERLDLLASALPSSLSDIPPDFIRVAPHLSDEQAEAIRAALSHPLSVLTGGPGTGKTTCLQALIKILEAAGKRYALASPTGRAAKRLSEATGRPASTIHRLLGFKPGEGFSYNLENPLLVDALVVDEASMLELVLAYSLLKALQPGTHLVLVGDVDQLPSVGAGDVLRDVIAGETAAVTRLKIIFRQAAGSHIITNAHRINRGEMPVFDKDSRDFFLFPAEKPDEAAGWVEDVVCERIPRKFGLRPAEIQVLAPMYRGPAGVNALNERLQRRINPSGAMKPEKRLYGTTFRSGDKVMQTQNNYDKEIFNGDIGHITGFDPINHTMTIEFDGRGLVYDWTEADQLVLAYAVTVHKAQGSEFRAVVLPLVTSHYMMLQRNLLYTAVTRARQLCVLVGSRRALHIAINNDKVSRRYTALDWRLRQMLAN